MDFATIIDKLRFLIVHVTVFELPIVLLAAAAGAFILATQLDKHNARLKEARFARKVGAFYAAIFLVMMLAHYLLI